MYLCTRNMNNLLLTSFAAAVSWKKVVLPRLLFTFSHLRWARQNKVIEMFWSHVHFLWMLISISQATRNMWGLGSFPCWHCWQCIWIRWYQWGSVLYLQVWLWYPATHISSSNPHHNIIATHTCGAQTCFNHDELFLSSNHLRTIQDHKNPKLLVAQFLIPGLLPSTLRWSCSTALLSHGQAGRFDYGLLSHI